MLAVVMVFLWAGVSFAENWIVYYDGGSLKSSYDADRVVKMLNGYDYWVRWEWIPDFGGTDKYWIRHLQMDLRNGEWWERDIGFWIIDLRGKETYQGSDDNWIRLKGQKGPDIKALLDGLRKYAR